ncbi:MAG: Cysteine-rich secretory protein family protein [Parcubacteria group bacterium ADurb.Bin316]|nr:MAG: Cysteine-rich secretory protein family protein [Parcubacteria group bacterium ADurb.Bin316]HOZ56307.1 CAP domain-containing protein [bacterium]
MDNKKSNKKWLIYLILGGFIIELLRFLYKLLGGQEAIKKNWKDFIKEEKREINELKTGKESFKEYCRDSCTLFVDYFVPSDCNDYRPKFLRPKSLVIVLVAMMAMKFFVTGYLFLIYPNEARMESQMTAEIFRLTNEDRIKNGLTPLSLNASLSVAALAKAEDMGLNNYFAHYGPDGKKPWEWIDRSQYSYVLAGENLGMNFSTANSVHVALMESPSHRQNILNEKYTDIGLAVISCTIDGQKTNVLVEMFGRQSATKLALEVKPASAATEITPKNEIPTTNTTTQVLGTDKTASEQKNEKKEPEVKPAAPETKEIAQATHFTSQTEAKEVELIPQAPETLPADNDAIDANFVASIEIDNEANLNNEVKLIAPVQEKKIGFATGIVKTTKIIYLSVLSLMIIALLINIFVRFKVQHKPIIIQTMVVILLIAGIAATKWHILESISGYIKIL